MNSFYVTLPSNSSMSLFPKNTQSSFTVKLANDIILSDDYEVALVEMSYAPYFLTDLGHIQIYNYFRNIYEDKNNSIEIPFEIVHSLQSSEFIEQLNLSISKNLELDNDFYKYKCAVLSTSIDELNRRFQINKKKKEMKNLELEIFKLAESNSNYVLIDKEDSVFADDFLKLNNVLPYNKNLMKWEFTNTQIIELSKTFKIKLFLVKTKFIIPDETSKINEKLITIAINSEYNIAKDLNYQDIELLGNLSYYVFENKKLELAKFSSPSFEIQNSVPKNKSFVKLIFNEKCPFKMALIGKLANIFLEMEQGFIHQNVIYKIDNHISAINYAVVYTDIVKSQYFGDISSNVLKIIPIKSKNDSEVVTFFDNLHYVPISRTRISTINIELIDLNGNYIKFEDKFSFVIIKLHFRKVKYE